MPRGHSLSIYARFSGKKRTSMYISREKGDRYYIQTRHNDLFFSHWNLFLGKRKEKLARKARVNNERVYSYFEKGCRKKMCTRQSRKVIWDMINTLFLTTVAVETNFFTFLWHSQTYVRGLPCNSFKFLWRTGHSKLPTIPFGVVACTFSDNLSRNTCISDRAHAPWASNLINSIWPP